MEKFKFSAKDKISRLPKSIGVYALKRGNKFLYIGKALNIKERVKNHLRQSGFKDNVFVNQAKKIGYIETNSEIEALILEADLIKKHQPRYNTIWRDDKNFFYICITKEIFPRIFITHQPHLKVRSRKYEETKKQIFKSSDFRLQTSYIGPFVEGKPLKQTLRFLRRAFPYYTLKKHPKNFCPYCHLGLCPGPNPDPKEYKKNINNLIGILKGERRSVIKDLKKAMDLASSLQNFEKAAKIRDQIRALERIFSYTRIIDKTRENEKNSEKYWPKIQKILQNILKTNRKILRIEAYDISNIQGKSATGSMVVFDKGLPNKNLYRKFKIKISGRPNDIGMLKEVLSRRFNHPEWLFPDLILIDGGKGQLNTAILQAKSYKLKAKIVALAKKKNELFVEGVGNPILLKTLPRPIFNLVLQLRDEAHRFAFQYHQKLRRKDLVGY